MAFYKSLLEKILTEGNIGAPYTSPNDPRWENDPDVIAAGADLQVLRNDHKTIPKVYLGVNEYHENFTDLVYSPASFPGKSFWCEFRLPKGAPDLRVGCWTDLLPWEGVLEARVRHQDSSLIEYTDSLLRAGREPHYIAASCYYSGYLNERGQEVVVCGACMIPIERDGSMMSAEICLRPSVTSKDPDYVWNPKSDGDNPNSNLFHFWGITQRAWIALACKNVTIVDMPGKPESKKQRKRQGGYKGLRFKELEIKATDGKRIRFSNRFASRPGETSYHLCRGHIRDYSEKGLFGNPDLRGRYWFADHYRGKKKHGEVVKSYRAS